MAQRRTSGWHYSRPELAAHHLRTFELGLVSATALYARRRMGKTEFLTKDLTPAAVAMGYAVGYCNLWQENQQPGEALVGALRQLAVPRTVGAKLKARLRTPLNKIKVSGKASGIGEGAAELEFGPRANATPNPLHEAFARFDASKNIALLLIDEAQILADRRYESLERALRSMLDTRKDRIKVMFTGSSDDRLRAMFGSERKPFYNWARIEPLPALGEEFVRELTARANTLTTIKLKPSEALRAFDEFKHVPELFRRFLSQYLSHPFDGVERAIQTCKHTLYTEEGFAKRWARMLAADRAVLQLVASGTQNLHGAQVLASLGKVLRLGKSADRSVPQNALRRLRENQILIQVEPGSYRFEDEAFRDWIITEAVERS